MIGPPAGGAEWAVPDDALVQRLWPDPGPRPLSDADVLDAYPMPDRQWLRVNFVSSVDGAVTLDGRSGGLGGPGDRRVFGLLRVACDAVLVGAGTVRVERYTAMVMPEHLRRLRLAQGRTADPVLAVVTRRLDLDPEHPLFRHAPLRPVLVTTSVAARAAGQRYAEVADVVGIGPSHADLGAAIEEMAGRGLRHVLCEGGPHLLGSLLGRDLVDELCLTLAPKLVGPGAGRIIAGPPSAVREMALSQILASDGELFLRYTRPGD